MCKGISGQRRQCAAVYRYTCSSTRKYHSDGWSSDLASSSEASSRSLRPNDIACFLVRITAEVTVPESNRFPNYRIFCDRPTHNMKLSNQNAKNPLAGTAKEFPENDIPARRHFALPANAPHPGNSACGRSSDLASSSETPSQGLRPNGSVFPRPPYSRGDCTGFSPVFQLRESTGFAAAHNIIIRIPPGNPRSSPLRESADALRTMIS